MALKPSQITKMELFVNVVIDGKSLTIFAKNSILDLLTGVLNTFLEYLKLNVIISRYKSMM